MATTYSSPTHSYSTPNAPYNVGFATYCVTATGSGTSSEGVVDLYTGIRSAIGSGGATTSDTAVGLRTVLRTATGSGVGDVTGVASAVAHLRALTGSGTGSSSVTQLRTTFATGSSSGSGTQAATGVRIVLRTATGSGTPGQSDAEINQLYLFLTPTDNEVDFAAGYRYYGDTIPGDILAFRLFRHYAPEKRGRNVWKLTDGSYTENEPSVYSSIDKVYHGGHTHLVDEDERSALVAAGYDAYVN